MAHHHSSLHEEKYPPAIKKNQLDMFAAPGQKLRVVYNPAGNNEYHMKETTRISPPTLDSLWMNKVSANEQVRKLEWEKIQASPDPERALERYNDFNSRWITKAKQRLNLFGVYKENAGYGYEAETKWLKLPRTQWVFPLFNWRPFTPDRLEPTYFGYSRKVIHD